MDVHCLRSHWAFGLFVASYVLLILPLSPSRLPSPDPWYHLRARPMSGPRPLPPGEGHPWSLIGVTGPPMAWIGPFVLAYYIYTGPCSPLGS
ncbi:hypothetical protein F4818DRAFT_422088 [Hypoxylon cercidicola]|nr:hypothetical protein F4818DRAFT_422088 [Hypoxylon cercidicola]